MTSTDLPGAEELWQYAGRRLAQGSDKLWHSWVTGNPADKGSLTGSKGSYTIGAFYRRRVVRGPDGQITQTWTPDFVRAGTPEPGWEEEDLAAQRVIEKRRLEKSAKRTSALDTAMGPLLAYLETAPLSWAAQEAILEHIWWKATRAMNTRRTR